MLQPLSPNIKLQISKLISLHFLKESVEKIFPLLIILTIHINVSLDYVLKPLQVVLMLLISLCQRQS